ncbi:095b59a0-0c03-48a1-95f8-4ab0b8fa3788 [Sclerotinia trifoliorum]|uniref:095b59a0-0c03-48a1-95f8-4ab0b8fa3788 n=1 Tax=Sclerotinia trifoliorum TaxID=28548 RepID=A0A8H2VUW5_9HELO|nr:095b59a0-0c03-48a1-95f8-4ab0b8fa3788 [Sclerotinia trifoliorum]
MHPQTFEVLRLESSFGSLCINKINDPFIIGVDHNLNPNFKARSLFYLFPRLPTELKLMIWAEAADDRQIVRIKPRARDGTEHEGFRADYAMPVVLHVCRDSRREALKRYTVIFKGILRNPIYFNYQRDYVSLVGSTTCEHFEILSGEDSSICEEIQKIQNVLEMVTGLGSGDSEEDVLLYMLSIWNGVKRLIIAERSPTWWGTFKEIWSDKEVKKLCKDAKANDTREWVATPDFPQVRIVKFDDILSAVVKEEKQPMDGTSAMLSFFDSLFEASSTYNIKRRPKKGTE